MKQEIVNLYKSEKNLEVKRNLLKLLNNKHLVLGLDDISHKTESLLEKIMKCRYGRNYNTVIFEIE